MTTVRNVAIVLGIVLTAAILILGFVLDVPNLIQTPLIDRKLQKLNYCLRDSDCVDFSYSNGCNFASINSSSYDQALEITQNVKGQLHCDYFFRKINFSCEDRKCVSHNDSTLN